MRVLVVDDDADFLSLLEVLLSAKGYEVTLAGTAADAESRAGEWLPDVVVMDISLPDASGLDLGRRLREICPRPTRLVALTGWQDRELAAAARRAGFDGYLTKPVTFTDLSPFLTPPTADE